MSRRRQYLEDRDRIDPDLDDTRDWIDPDLEDGDELFLEDDDPLALIPDPLSGGKPSGSVLSLSWSQRLRALNRGMDSTAGASSAPPEDQLLYVVNVAGTTQGYGLILEVMSRQQKQDGSW